MLDWCPTKTSDLPLLISVDECKGHHFLSLHLFNFSSSSSSSSTAHRAQQEKNSETDSGSNCDKVSIHVVSPCALSSLVFFCCLLWWWWGFFSSRVMDNCRMKTATADMPLSQRRRRTWRCSGGEGSAVALSSVIKLHGRWTGKTVIYSIFYLLAQIIHLIGLFASVLSLSAGTLWTSCWKLREPTWRSCSAYCKWVLVPKNGYSLFFTCAQKFMFCVWCVYRDMLLRWITQQWFTSCLLLCRTKRRFCLATCQKSTTSTGGEGAPSACHWWYQHTVTCHVVSVTGALPVETHDAVAHHTVPLNDQLSLSFL